MRETKFRGKLSHSNQWIFGNLIIAQNNKPYIIPFEVLEPDGHHLIINSDSAFWVSSETVGQFTGLKDSKGNEIYEGDILEWKHSEQGDTDNYFSKREPVVFDNGSFGFERWSLSNGCLMEKLTHVSAHAATDDLYYIEFEAKKIGNIHDNPELLKQK